VGASGISYFNHRPHKKISPGLLYLVQGEVNGTKFLKVGITERSVMSRYGGDISKYNIRPIASKNIPLFNAFLLEQEILRKYCKDLERPDDKFGGKTECIRYDQTILADILRDYFN
jgi:hypothetical protein